MKTITKKSVTKVERVRQSELGLFLKLIAEDTPIEEFDTLVDLAKRVSIDFNVDCIALDLETFFNLDDLPDENFEVESRKQQFYRGEYYE